MARPKKQEVDYFPHYCDHGKVLFILENHFKNDGYAVFYKIEELLAKTEGHCYDCSKLENWEYLLSKMGTTEEIILGIIEKLAAMGVIDKPLWSEKRIWMQSFVDSISDVYARRKVDLPGQPELLHTETPLSGVNDDINPQSKVKYSKVKYIYMQHFEDFWNLYPRRNGKIVGRKECLEHCKKFNNDAWDKIIQGTTNYAKSKQAVEGYAKDPIRFLKKELWNDWLEAEQASPQTGRAKEKWERILDGDEK